VLTPFAELLADRGDGAAVGAFTCYDLETAGAVLGAAGSASAGVVLLIGARSYTGRDGRLLLAALLAAADASPTRACVQLDHCGDLEVIRAALAAGAGAVMADGSTLPIDENASFVAAAVALARAHGAGVEAELGHLSGDEDVAAAVSAGGYTDPAQAGEFAARTGVGCLAVSIGNVHGIYRDPPAFDWDRLAAIRAAVPTPLSLHGASGIPDAMVRRSVTMGVAKINVNTELRRAYLDATAQTLPETVAGSGLSALHAAQQAAVERVVHAKLRAFDTRAGG
jgi:tagatose 1,6-diphosphate aldolase GatY/KbaY